MHNDFEDVLELPDGQEPTPVNLYKHAREVLQNRWPEAELTIRKNPNCASHYAENVIKGRWPEAEPIIMKEPRAAVHYAEYVIKGRWREAEPYIMKEPKEAYWYTIYVTKCRWPEAEPTIMEDPGRAENYIESVIKPKLLIALGALSEAIGQKINIFQMVEDWEITIDTLSKIVGQCNESIKESNQAELRYKIDRS